MTQPLTLVEPLDPAPVEVKKEHGFWWYGNQKFFREQDALDAKNLKECDW